MRDALEALRSDSLKSFFAKLSSDEKSELLGARNHSPYATWFSGLGATLLQIASFIRPENARWLITQGASIDLHSACAIGETRTIRTLLGKNPKTASSQVDTFFPIQYALADPESLRCLLESGDSPNRPLEKVAWYEWESEAAIRGLSLWKPIHMVALGRHGASNIVAADTLWEYGVDLFAPSKPFGDTVLHLAATYSRCGLIRWLIDKGVDVDIPRASGLHSVATTDLFENSYFHPFDATGQTPLMLALAEGQLYAVDVLLSKGANLDSRDSEGFAPLHYAAGAFWKENIPLVEELLRRGATVDAKDRAGRTASDIARSKGYKQTARLLDSKQP